MSNMRHDYIRNMKFILSGILTLSVCFYLNVEETASGGIYYYGNAENAEIYSEEPLFVKADTLTKVETKAVKIKEAVLASKPAENEITQQELIACVFPTFPFESSSSSFSQVGSESAAITFQHKTGNDEQQGKACRENAYRGINNSDFLLYNPKHRQKLSITATQCGELTSYGAQSPPSL